MYDQEQWKYIGQCIHCGTQMYSNDDGVIITKNPAPDCICELDMEDSE